MEVAKNVSYNETGRLEAILLIKKITHLARFNLAITYVLEVDKKQVY